MVSVFISVGRDGTDGRHGIPGRNGIPGRQGLPGNYNYILVLGLIFLEPHVGESGKFLLVESGIWVIFCLWNPESRTLESGKRTAQGIGNPTNNWNPVPLKKNPDSISWNLESKDWYCLGLPYMKWISCKAIRPVWIQGRSRPSPLIFRPNWRPKGKKGFFEAFNDRTFRVVLQD